jgi:ribonuclease J
MDAGYDREHVILADNGEIINFVDGERVESTTTFVGDIFVDGSLIGDVNLDVIKDRETLANEGAVIINVYYDVRLRKLISDPTIVTKGLVGKMEDEELSSKICSLSKSIFENSLWKKNYSLDATLNTISEEITKLILTFFCSMICH